MCVGDRERTEVCKRHVDKVTDEEKKWDGTVNAEVDQRKKMMKEKLTISIRN